MAARLVLLPPTAFFAKSLKQKLRLWRKGSPTRLGSVRFAGQETEEKTEKVEKKNGKKVEKS